MENFPSNSHEARLVGNDLPNATPETEDKPRVKQAVRTPAEVTKMPLHNRLFRAFGGIDGRTVVENFVRGILIPTAKEMGIKTVDDLAHNLKVQVRAAFGDTRPVPRSPSLFNGSGPVGNSPRASRIPYDGYSRPTPREDRLEPDRVRRPASRYHDVNDYVIDSQAEALDVLDVLRDMILTMGFVTVHDFKETIQVEPEHTDIEWGWENLDSRSIQPIRIRDGRYRLNLPRPVYLAN